VRFGVVGTGFWARRVHAAGLAEHPDAELVGVWGRDATRALQAGAEFDVPGTDDLAWLLDRVDAVAVAVPPDVQVPIAVAAAEAGKHLLLEKPLALTVADADRVVDAVRTAGVASVAALGLESADPGRSAARAEAMSAPVLPRTRGAAEAELSAVAAPDGTQVFFTRTVTDGWPADFLPTGERPGPGAGITHVDHVGLTQPFDSFDEAGLFYRAVLGLESQEVTELAAPFGLVRTRAVTDPDRSVRLALSAATLRRGGWAPGVPEPQYVALATDDLVATAAALRAAGAPLLALPANYADDLEARFDLPADLLAAVREHGLMYEEDGAGGYLHLATELLGDRVFVEVVQRLGGYDGYGTADAPVRMAAHRRRRQAAVAPIAH